MSEKWEQGLVRALSANCRGIALPTDQQEIEATRIFSHIKNFDTNYKRYFIAFAISEVVNFALCIAVFMYYFYLLNIPQVHIIDIIKQSLSFYPIREDQLLELFPREIACLYSSAGPTGILESKNFICKVTNNEFNEYFHVLAFIVSGLVAILYMIHLVYVSVTFFVINANKPTTKQYEVWDNMTLRKRLILILVRNNIDAETYNTLIQKISDATLPNNNTQQLNDNAPNRYGRQVVNFIQEDA